MNKTSSILPCVYFVEGIVHVLCVKCIYFAGLPDLDKTAYVIHENVTLPCKGMKILEMKSTPNFLQFSEASRNLDGLVPMTYRYKIYDTSWLPSIWTRAHDYVREALNREYTSELCSKLSVMVHRKGDEMVITIVRLDNVTGGKDDGSLYKPIDGLWRDVPGWSSELKLCFESQVECLVIPPNTIHDSLQFSVPMLNSILPENTETEIPREIFFTWNSASFNECPEILIKTMIIVKLLNPSYNVNYFSPEHARNFIASKESPEVLRAYDLITPRAFQVDFWRYVVLFHEGGVYLDAKITTIYPLDSFLPSTGGLLVKDIRGAGLLNGILAMPKRSRLMRLAIDGIVENVSSLFYGESPLDISGPNHLFRCFNKLSAAEQSEFKLIQFHNSGILAHDQDIPVFAVHNGEYRRILSKPGMASHYEEQWINRSVYGEKPSSTLAKGHDDLLSSGAFWFLALFIVIFSIFLIRKLFKAPKVRTE